MRRRTAFLVVAALFAASALISNLRAEPLVNIETVTVGDAGNAADTTGYGAVSNVFAIGKYEVTIGQYAAFLNSVAATDTYGLYSTFMGLDLNVAGITREGTQGSYSYNVTNNSGNSANRPITYVSWFDAARFANWMHNGATNGASTETGAYTLNGATEGIVARNANATWWIPSEDEWFKAAYYKGGSLDAGYWLYPTQSDSAPNNSVGGDANQANYYAGDFSVTQSPNYSPLENYLTEIGSFSGSASAYGSFDQGGNVMEWNDAIIGADSRGWRGGDWQRDQSWLEASDRKWGLAQREESFLGFRLATVPEPSTYALLLITGAGALWWARRRR